eukprot:4716397-Alexandrium_andersonii.AAC.1
MKLWSWPMKLNLPRGWLPAASQGGLPPRRTPPTGASGASGLSAGATARRTGAPVGGGPGGGGPPERPLAPEAPVGGVQTSAALLSHRQISQGMSTLP